MTEERVQVSMSDIRAYFPGGAVQHSKRNDAESEPSALQSNELPAKPDAEPQYVATSPSGAKVNIPKELFVALSDFIKTTGSKLHALSFAREKEQQIAILNHVVLIRHAKICLPKLRHGE